MSPNGQHPAGLALDVGGTKLAVGVVTSDGRVVLKRVEPTRVEEGWERTVGRLVAMAQEALLASGLTRVVPVVGISCGGPLDTASGRVLGPPNLPGWDDVPIVARVQEATGLPAVLVNDASAAAVAESRFGAGRGAPTMLYLTISTGIGGGLVLDGRLHNGAARNGGEPGHVCVRPGGRRCPCGRRGCLEAYASGSSIARRAAELLSTDGRPSTLRSLSMVRAEDVAAAARAGDLIAREVWDETTDILGQGLTDLVNVLEPDAVVLGGGVTAAGDQLIEPVRAHVRAGAMRPAGAAVRIHIAQLGSDTCLVGAAALALDYLTTLQGALR